jgi:hypothetical protein
MAMTDRLEMDAHFHGHDGALLLASFEDITLLFESVARAAFSNDKYLVSIYSRAYAITMPPSTFITCPVM